MLLSESTGSEETETTVLDDSMFHSVNSSLSDSYQHPLGSSSDELDSSLFYSVEDSGNVNKLTVDNIRLDIEGSEYSESAISPKREGNGGSVNSRISEFSSSLGYEYLKITVLSPEKENEVSSSSIVPGSNTYVTYLINTKTNMRGFAGSEISVRRRFRDVVTLADRLSDSYRGFFIAPRPRKSVVESQVMQKQEFLEQRRMALEKYLRRLAAHPVIRKSDELRAFLQVPGKQLFVDSRSDIASRETVEPRKGGGGLLRSFKELKQSVTNDCGNSRPPLLEEDKEFLDKKKKLRDFEQRLTDTSKKAESLVKAQQDIRNTMVELGSSFIKLTKFEYKVAILSTQRARAANMRNTAKAFVSASKIYRELNAKTEKNMDILHEYLGEMLAVHNAYSDRASALLTVQTLLSELSSLQLKAQKLEASSSNFFVSDESKKYKMKELKDTMKITEDLKNCAFRKYEQIKENNRIELERLEKEKHADFLKMSKGFVNDQVSSSEKMSKLWSKVAKDTQRYAKESS